MLFRLHSWRIFALEIEFCIDSLFFQHFKGVIRLLPHLHSFWWEIGNVWIIVLLRMIAVSLWLLLQLSSLLVSSNSTIVRSFHPAWGLRSFLDPYIFTFHCVWKILGIISLNIYSSSFSLPSLFAAPMTCRVGILLLPHGSPDLSTFLFSPISLRSSDWILSIDLFWGHWLFPLPSCYWTIGEPVSGCCF